MELKYGTRVMVPAPLLAYSELGKAKRVGFRYVAAIVAMRHRLVKNDEGYTVPKGDPSIPPVDRYGFFWAALEDMSEMEVMPERILVHVDEAVPA